jgi:glycosyltransferase involved in cell wall biosynthesis
MYNSELTIVETLNSVFNQKYENLEIIIINDGSTDDSKSKVEDTIQRFNTKDIKLINQDNLGVSVARNRGIIEAKGEYIAFLDSDDVWLKNKLSTQIKLMNKYKDIHLLGTLLTSDTNKKSIGRIKDISFISLLFKNYFMTPTVVVKKEVFEKVGYFKSDKRYSEDYDLWLRIAERFRTSIYMGRLATLSVENNGLSSNLIKMQKGEIDNYQEIYNAKRISSILFILVIIFSNIKFTKRILLKRLRGKR